MNPTLKHTMSAATRIADDATQHAIHMVNGSLTSALECGTQALGSLGALCGTDGAATVKKSLDQGESCASEVAKCSKKSLS